MIEVKDIRVRSLDLDRLYLWWGVKSTSEDPQDYDTYVLRANSPLGPYTPLHPDPLVDLYHFMDQQPRLLNRWRRLYYRIRLVHRASGEIREFPDDNGASVDPPLALDALEAARYEEVIFREHNARPCWLFKRRDFGPRCPHCWDERANRPTTKRCHACYGTGYLRGFHSPIQFWCQIDPAPEAVQQSSVDESQEQLTRARCTFFPPISPKDVIVELENIRWRVSSNNPTRRLRSSIHQELTVYRIPEGSIEFELPLNIDLEEWKDQPAREFVNPQHLGAAKGDTLDMQDIKHLYRWRM